MLAPSRELELPFTRVFGSTTLSVLGLAIPGLSVAANLTGGLYAQPIRVPIDYDRTRPGYLFALLYNPGAVGPAAGNVVINSTLSYTVTNSAPTDVALTQVVGIPGIWPAGDSLEVQILNAGGPFIPGGTLSQLRYFGIRVFRDGPNAADTWNASLGLVQNLVLTYSRLCQFCDCGP